MAYKGLDALEKLNEDSQRSAGSSVPWVKLKGGQSVKVRFLQELDSGSKYYREDKGQIVVLAEHSDPANFRLKMQCSMDTEGRCYGCEQHKANPKAKWGRKLRLYAAVLVKDDEGSEVKILSQGIGSNSITPALIEYAKESGAVTDRVWKITRTGDEFNNTSYAIIGFDREPDGFDDLDDYEVPDLEKVATRQIPYEEQAAFFNNGAMPAEAPASGGGGWATDDKKADSISSW